MQRVLTEFKEVQKLIYDHTGVTLDEFSPFYQYISYNSEYTSIVFQIVDVTSVGSQDTQRLIICFRKPCFGDSDEPMFNTSYFNNVTKQYDEWENVYTLVSSKKIDTDPDGYNFYMRTMVWYVYPNDNSIGPAQSYENEVDEYYSAGDPFIVYTHYDSDPQTGDYLDFNFTIIETFTNLVSNDREVQQITSMEEWNALFKEKCGIDIPTTNAEYEDYSMYDKMQAYLADGKGMNVIVRRKISNDEIYPTQVWIFTPYNNEDTVDFKNLYIRSDSDSEVMLSAGSYPFYYTRFLFDHDNNTYEAYLVDNTIWYNDYTFTGYYPDYMMALDECIELIYGVKELPSMDEAVEQYRDLMERTATAIKETIGLRPDTTRLETWLYNTPRQYSWSKFRNYTYRDSLKEDIINECINALNGYNYEAYRDNIIINYYETGSYSSSSTVCYLDIYRNTTQTRYSDSVKTYICRYKLKLNSTDTTYPKYISIDEKYTENITDISAYGVNYSDTVFDQYWIDRGRPDLVLMVPKTTIKPYEFAKTITGSGEDSNHYNYRWILRDTANAIRTVSGSSADINAQDIPDAIRALSNEQGGNTE